MLAGREKLVQFSVSNRMKMLTSPNYVMLCTTATIKYDYDIELATVHLITVHDLKCPPVSSRLLLSCHHSNGTSGILLLPQVCGSHH